jgi:hypothetical protein
LERTQAIKTLGKLLGKSLGYQVDREAPSADQREEAQAELARARHTMSYWAEEKRQACKRALAADPDYQECLKNCTEASGSVSALQSVAFRYKFTVGTSSGLFFRVEARGDSWEDCIKKVEAKQRARA